MSGENRRSREAVRNSVRTYGVKVMDPASLPLKRTKERESQESVSRFSEKSLHSHYEIGEGFCKSLMQRIPYATLLATVLCIAGILIFSTGRKRAVVVTNAMINEVLEKNTNLVAVFDIVFLVLEILTAILAVMILIIGILATGDTRARVYSGWKSRAGGTVCCALLIIANLIFFLLWLLTLWLLSNLVFVIVISKMQCDAYFDKNSDKNSLYLPFANIFVWSKTVDFVINNKTLVKKYCKDFVEKASASYIIASVGNFLIIFSLVLFLICLAANYARIRSQAKLQELEELRDLKGDLHSSKDRF